MTIKELIEVLQKEDQNKEVLLSSDPEGNNFWTLDKIDLLGEDDKTITIYPNAVYEEE